MAALEGLRTDIEAYQKNTKLHPDVRNELEQGYLAILQKQAEWERGGFWNEDNEKGYQEYNKRLN